MAAAFEGSLVDDFEFTFTSPDPHAISDFKAGPSDGDVDVPPVGDTELSSTRTGSTGRDNIVDNSDYESSAVGDVSTSESSSSFKDEPNPTVRPAAVRLSVSVSTTLRQATLFNFSSYHLETVEEREARRQREDARDAKDRAHCEEVAK